MKTKPFRVVRRREYFVSDDKRVILRYLNFQHPGRIRSIVTRLLKIPQRDVPHLLEAVMGDFAARHRDVRQSFEENYRLATSHIRVPEDVDEERRLLIGSYFTMEYSIEAAALFNPSIVMHLDQSGLAEGAVRFLMSLRATGEGHVSSIVFRRGVIDPSGRLSFDPPPRYAYSARPVPDKMLDKEMFRAKLRDVGPCRDVAVALLEKMPDHFSLAQLTEALEQAGQQSAGRAGFRDLAAEMLWLARANYELRFPEDCLPAEIVVFPATQHEQRGMEDLRMVRFVEEDGEARYYGTYTAYDGARIHPMLMETGDFQTFHVHTLSGRYARNKGMALFPRKVDGCYMMLSRHDGENLYVLRSQNLYVWNVSQKLQGPAEPWELVHIGNCGSPLETDAGWIVLTHGVGPVRKYCIGALLLDRNDPSRVLGRLKEPMLAPTARERAGYVPNVVYSCGSMIHKDELIIPYAMSDSRTGFATVSVAQLIAHLKASPGDPPGQRRRRKTPRSQP